MPFALKPFMKYLLLLFILLISVAVITNYDYIRDHRDRAFVGAAWEGNVVVMRLLCIAGADVNVNAPGRGRALTGASWEGHLDAMTFLIAKGADVNAREKLGTTALIAATYGGQVDAVKLLLSRGADVNASGDDGTALSWARAQGRTELVELLKQAGAKE